MPDLTAVMGQVLRALREFGHERIELEIRLGHKAGAFRPGVDAQAWARLKAALDAGQGWSVAHSVTTEQIDASGSKVVLGQDQKPLKVVHKRRLADTDYDTDSPWCARVSLSLEEPGSVQETIVTTYERRKERWSYAFKCWTVDLTRVAGNLPHQLDEDTESYEVEIELADTREFFTRTVDSILQWGWDLAADMCRLLEHGAAAG